MLFEMLKSKLENPTKSLNKSENWSKFSEIQGSIYQILPFKNNPFFQDFLAFKRHNGINQSNPYDFQKNEFMNFRVKWCEEYGRIKPFDYTTVFKNPVIIKIKSRFLSIFGKTCWILQIIKTILFMSLLSENVNRFSYFPHSRANNSIINENRIYSAKLILNSWLKYFVTCALSREQ
jgi:hypothetical protein